MTLNNQIKNLIEICLQNSPCFSSCLLGNHYCNLGISGHNIDCPYFRKEEDQNGMHVCKWYEEPKQKEIQLKITLAQVNCSVNLS